MEGKQKGQSLISVLILLSLGLLLLLSGLKAYKSMQNIWLELKNQFELDRSLALSEMIIRSKVHQAGLSYCAKLDQLIAADNAVYDPLHKISFKQNEQVQVYQANDPYLAALGLNQGDKGSVLPGTQALVIRSLRQTFILPEGLRKGTQLIHVNHPFDQNGMLILTNCQKLFVTEYSLQGQQLKLNHPLPFDLYDLAVLSEFDYSVLYIGQTHGFMPDKTPIESLYLLGIDNKRQEIVPFINNLQIRRWQYKALILNLTAKINRETKTSRIWISI